MADMETLRIDGREIPVYRFTTVVVGSGAASLNCADRLHELGHGSLAIVTERVGGGTSFNAGSDKQTYYKVSVSGRDTDSPREMAETLYQGGSMHGDLALVEGLGSLPGFYHLASIGVPFPHDRYGAYAGYKTDHDPKGRATSCGPWTSRLMVESLLKEVRRRGIPVFDGFEAVALIAEGGRVMGLVALDRGRLESEAFGLTVFQAENLVFGVGGPGGLYCSSVYPEGHLGAIGLALEVGAPATNLTESQFGLASLKFRWNVSGSYQQVVPRYISTDREGREAHEFLNPYFPSPSRLATAVFLKGYQWPFDPRKILDHGSSLIDILVTIETAGKGRRVFLDFRENPQGFRLEDLEEEARRYLENSGALLGTPLERLLAINPLAVELYRDNNIDLAREPLEVAVCAQHNNGGLSGDIWWESSLRHLFPVGEVNGGHGVYRPGGSALNSGQVGSQRAAQRIARVYGERTVSYQAFLPPASRRAARMLEIARRLCGGGRGKISVEAYRSELQERMSGVAAHIRRPDQVEAALEQAYDQIDRFLDQAVSSRAELSKAMANRHLVLAHAAYLDAIRTYLEEGGGSRGSYLVMDPKGIEIFADWRFRPEVPAFRDKVLETALAGDRFHSRFVPRRPIPETDNWFETVWSEYRSGAVFQDR